MENEKRLIYANDPLKQLSDYMEKLHCTDDYRDGIYRGMEMAESYIENAPTVDAVEVVHGRWIFKHNPITDPKRYFMRIVCSECNLHTGQKSNYCPNCGAKMDGDRNG